MAVRHGYGKVAGADALVFAYDTGDTRNSYKGEPTNNLFGTTAMELKSDNPSITSHIINGSDSIGTYIIKDTVNAPWYAGLRIYDNGVRPLTAGVSYVLSFECRSPQSGWSWALDANATGGGWSGNDLGRLSNTNLVFDKTGGITYTSDMVNTWQRVTFRATMKDSSVFTGASAYPHDSFFTTANNVKIYYRNAQLEVGRTNATQFTTGTRSATQGLLDLTGNTTLNLTNAAFTSDAQPTFDGTNTTIPITGLTISATQNKSYEAIIKLPSGYNQIGIIIGGRSNSTNTFSVNESRQIRGSEDDEFLTGNALNTDQWYHVAYTFEFDGNDAYQKLYVNGELDAQRTKTNYIDTYVESTQYIGSESRFGYRFNGDIPVCKVYNRALTADEVRNNFRLYKTRFGI